jgi:hypothetical protein
MQGGQMKFFKELFIGGGSISVIEFLKSYSFYENVALALQILVGLLTAIYFLNKILFQFRRVRNEKRNKRIMNKYNNKFHG